MTDSREHLKQCIYENSSLDTAGINELTAALMAAGYRKPRIITTAEEVGALPNRSVIRTTFGDPVQIMWHIEPDREQWHWVTNSGPATVLHEPEA